MSTEASQVTVSIIVMLAQSNFLHHKDRDIKSYKWYDIIPQSFLKVNFW